MSQPEQAAMQSGRCNTESAWTIAEIGLLREHAHLGATAVAALLGRSTTSVRSQAQRMRISLRRRGERRGLLLGQPAGESWGSRQDLARIREAAIAGQIDLAAVEQALERIVAGDPPPTLCPICVARVADHRSGVCRPCHLRALAEAHRDAEALHAAQQELWKARQSKSRSRKESADGNAAP